MGYFNNQDLRDKEASGRDRYGFRDLSAAEREARRDANLAAIRTALTEQGATLQGHTCAATEQESPPNA